MKNRIIWQLLTTLTEEERVHFGQWLGAELGHTQHYVQQLYQYLTTAVQAPAPSQVWAALYPDLPFDDDRLRKLMRDLSRWLETYLAIQAFRSDPDLQDLYLLRALRQRRQPGLFRRLLTRQHRREQQRPDRSASYFRQQFWLESEWRRFQLTYQPQVPADPAPLKASLQAWWWHERLELACLEVARARRLGQAIPADDAFINAIRHLDEAAAFPALRLYLSVHDLLAGRLAIDPAQVRLHFQAVTPHIRMDERRNLLHLLLNYHIGELNAQSQDANAREILHLYESGLETGLLLHDGYLAWDQYKNIITICLRLGQAETAWRYLHDLRDRLPPEVREDAYLFNLGQYYFAEGRFAEVIATYRDHRFALPLYDVQARAYLLQAHYEREGPGQEWLISQAETGLRYVRQQDLPALHRHGYLHFFRLLRRLMTAHTPAKRQRLLARVAKTYPLPHRSWLITQASRLNGG